MVHVPEWKSDLKVAHDICEEATKTLRVCFGRRLPAHAHGQGQAGSGWEDLGEEERFATEPGSGVGEAPLMARRVGSSGHLGVAPLVGASPGLGAATALLLFWVRLVPCQRRSEPRAARLTSTHPAMDVVRNAIEQEIVENVTACVLLFVSALMLMSGLFIGSAAMRQTHMLQMEVLLLQICVFQVSPGLRVHLYLSHDHGHPTAPACRHYHHQHSLQPSHGVMLGIAPMVSSCGCLRL